MSEINKLAFIHPEAKIGNNVIIDAFAYIDKDVVIGDGCHIYPHVSLREGTRLGNNITIYDGAVIAARPQDFRWKGDDSYVTIGDNTTIREHVIINRSIYASKSTSIGSGCFIMAQSHIGHDSIIGDHCVLGNACKIAGNCKIGNYCILSSSSLVHENCQVGEWVLVKGGCRVTNHVPPYVIMAHNPISYYGVNAFILRKGNFEEDTIDDIAKCYRHLYQCYTSPFNAVKRMFEDVKPGKERDYIIDFIKSHDYKVAAAKQERDLID